MYPWASPSFVRLEGIKTENRIQLSIFDKYQNIVSHTTNVQDKITYVSNKYKKGKLANNQKNTKLLQNYIAIQANLCYTICKHKMLA